jgi:hypothetical protein
MFHRSSLRSDQGLTESGNNEEISRNEGGTESFVPKKKFPFIKSDANVASGVGGPGGPGGIGTLSWAGSETSIAKLPAERSENPSGTASPAPLSTLESVRPAEVRIFLSRIVGCSDVVTDVFEPGHARKCGNGLSKDRSISAQ